MNKSSYHLRRRILLHGLKHRSIVVFILFTVSSWAVAQKSHSPLQFNTEQLLQYYRSLKDSSQRALMPAAPYGGKCGLGINAALHNQWNNLSVLQKAEIQALVQAGPFQKNKVIGKFHIYYDTTGNNEPALLSSNNQRIPNTAEAYVDSLGRIFNEVYQVEINTLGYIEPPLETGETGYRILITDMSGYPSGTYGATNWDSPALNPGDPAPRYPCFTEIHRDFSTFPTKGMNALRVTAAHEFHHVIQVGSYGFRLGDIYAHEITSTWFEDVVYTDVNDYYFYLPLYFSNFGKYVDGTALSFNSDKYGGYERCIWAHFLAKRFDLNIMRDIWTNMGDQSIPASVDAFIESNRMVLLNRGSDLQTAFSEFSYWNYYTADRANPIEYYPEGDHYPRFQAFSQTEFYGSTSTIIGDVQPLSTSMYEFAMAKNTITSIVANVDIEKAKVRSTTIQKVDVTLTGNLMAN